MIAISEPAFCECPSTMSSTHHKAQIQGYSEPSKQKSKEGDSPSIYSLESKPNFPPISKEA